MFARSLLLIIALPAAVLGAEPKHWAYIAPIRPPLPQVRNPKSAILNAVDAFVRARLEKEGLAPSPEAERAVLLRRVTLDLIGLPPTIGELDAFLADTRPDAFERVVDHLLASPHFGERWARHWLDLARYADSHGYQKDDLREIWPFRDWVIHALNADMPFDQFTIEQIAGDLLPKPTESQRIATGFHRCCPTNVEAGSDPDETRVLEVFDRVNTTATVWLGTTLECCQCHDHKYDPFTQKDYYRFFAFFNSTAKEAERAKANALGSIKFLGPKLPYHGATTLVMEELPQRRPTYILKRGDFRSPGAEVQPGTPAALTSDSARVSNRLDLARWLVSCNNPLTARVTVNRLWAELFGHGMVTTPENFGTRGERPTHPELLDWLAAEFVDRGLSMKHVIRTIVTSSTYRQSSRQTPELKARDPLNRFYARGPRVRMDAEMVRDNALAISGLLNHKLGGPPIRPPQPEGLWPKVSGEKLEYVATPTPERNRRGIYVVWKRSSPYPSMANFDATARLTCTVSRPRSNSPLQALTLLNDPVYVEAANALAQRIQREAAGRPLADQLRHAFRLCLAREPKPAELELLQTLHQKQSTERSTLAPWQAVATALLNLDEMITKP
jgi:hypothetical protein